MNRIIWHLIIFNLCYYAAQASPFSWADSIGGKGTGSGRSMVIDLNNNIYVCGQLNGEFKLTTTIINGNTGFLIKYNNSGTIIWAKSFPGLVCKSLSIDFNENVCMAGYFQDSVQIGKYLLKSQGKQDFFMAKFDTLGNILWAKEGGGLGNDRINSVSSDPAGNIFITGSFENYINFNQSNSILSLGKTDMFVAEYDTFGRFLWSASGGGDGDDAGTAIGLDLEGNVFVTGYFNGLATFHNNTLQSNGGNNIFIVKYSAAGYQLSTRTAGGVGDAIPNAISLDGSGNIYMAGVFNGACAFGNKTLTATGNDGFVAAYDNNLNINWLNQVTGPGDDEALGIKADWQSNVLVTGVFNGTADLKGQSLTSKGLTDIFITKYDAAGRLLWARGAGGTGADSAFSIANDYNGIASITGMITDSAHFGDITLAADTGGSFFISQLQYDPAGISDQDIKKSAFRVFPNPTSGMFSIQPNSALSSRASVSVSDITGKEIQHKTPASDQEMIFDVSIFPDGIYFMRLVTDSGIYVQKIIKNSR